MNKSIERIFGSFETENANFYNKAIHLFLTFYNISFTELKAIDNRMLKKFFVYVMITITKIPSPLIAVKLELSTYEINNTIIQYKSKFKNKDKDNITAALYDNYLYIKKKINNLCN